MLKPALEKYLAELRAAGRPALLADGKIVIGRIVITASPSLEAPAVDRLRLVCPNDHTPAELPLMMNLFRCVFPDPEVWFPLARRLGAGLLREGKFQEQIGGIRVDGRFEAGCRVVEWTATYPQTDAGV
jgi:hypothetical protein